MKIRDAGGFTVKTKAVKIALSMTRDALRKDLCLWIAEKRGRLVLASGDE